jgi:hypothetical protein
MNNSHRTSIIDQGWLDSHPEFKEAAKTPESGSQLTPEVIVALVRLAFYTVFGISVSVALFSYCHLDFWPSFWTGFVIGTLGFLLGWIFWGLCAAGVLAMFGAVHFAIGVLILLGFCVVLKMVMAGIKGAVIEAIRESKKDTSSTPARAAPAPWQPPAPVPKKQEPVSVDLEIVREVPPDAIVPYVTPTQRRLVQRTRRPL